MVNVSNGVAAVLGLGDGGEEGVGDELLVVVILFFPLFRQVPHHQVVFLLPVDRVPSIHHHRTRTLILPLLRYPLRRLEPCLSIHSPALLRVCLRLFMRPSVLLSAIYLSVSLVCLPVCPMLCACCEGWKARMG